MSIQEKKRAEVEILQKVYQMKKNNNFQLNCLALSKSTENNDDRHHDAVDTDASDHH